MNYDAVIVASGKGERAGLGYNKVFYRMKDGKTVLEHAASLFAQDPDCKRIVVVTNPEDYDRLFQSDKLVVTNGGATRKDSVENGLKMCESDYVFIHDGARPFLHKEALRALKEAVEEKKAAVLGKMAVDTIKQIEDGKIVRTIDRSTIFMAETPQAFERRLILDCFDRCREGSFTDDASLAEASGYEVAAVIDAYDNRKLTKEEDFRDL